MTNVPLLDLGPQNRALEAQFETAFRDVLRSNMVIMGPTCIFEFAVFVVMDIMVASTVSLVGCNSSKS